MSIYLFNSLKENQKQGTIKELKSKLPNVPLDFEKIIKKDRCFYERGMVEV